ncbi:verrucotoxin subunit beta-like [Betta splendens]|uniref:Verrucotoxin subunit beta-like n=1 Tax=Betta splendens TaxID=158456 RepID=A0A9W2XDX6_BETSP|nr:verrucotoxin subunit beta-like [Betta splendens]
MMDTKSMELGFHGTEQQRRLSASIKGKLLELNDKAEKEISYSPAAAKHICQRSIRLVNEAQQVLEDFNELEMRCNMLMIKTDGKFPQISEKIGRFKEMCSEFNVKFQQTLAKKLPSIGVGGQEEAALAEILNKKHSSPFNSDVLKKWIRWKEREVYTVNFFTDMINTKIVPSEDHVDIEKRHAEYAVCFVFTSLGASEPYLSALSHYLNRTNPDEPQHPHSDDVEKDQWFADKKITDKMRHKARLFRDFAEANKEKKNMRFLTLSLTDEMFKGCSIYFYQRWFSFWFPAIKNFEPPSKPKAVTVSDVTHNSVTLKVSPPRFRANNMYYCIEYRVCGDDKWQREIMSNPEEVTVSGLRLDTEYEFRCRAVFLELVGPHHDVSGSVRTLPCCPPGKPQVEPELSVSWEEPSELGPDVQTENLQKQVFKVGLNKLKEIKETSENLEQLEAETKPGWKNRVQSLMAIKEKAVPGGMFELKKLFHRPQVSQPST